MSDDSHNTLHESIIKRLDKMEDSVLSLTALLNQMRGRDSVISALVGLIGAFIGAWVSK